MATVLFCPVTFNLAETTRMIEIARALGPEHTPVFMGYEQDFAHLITDAGFDHRPCAPSWTAADRDRAMRLDRGRALRSPFTTDLVAARVAVERDLIRRTGAAAVVIGSNLTSLISARAEGVPLFYALPFALSPPHVDQTRHLGLVPGRGTSSDAGRGPEEFTGDARDPAPGRRPARGLDRSATAALRWAYGHAPLAPRAFTRVPRGLGLPPLRTAASLLEADHNLLTVMPWELTGYRLPPHYVRVGPIFAHLDTPLPPLVTELAARPEPLIHLSLGSSADRDLALAAARGLARLPVNVLAPVRHYLSEGDTLPDNVHVTDLLPAHRLGGVVDAAVLHGGQGTVQTACATGVPFVGMGLQPEQAWNVAVCVAQGNAVGLSPRQVRTPAFPAAVRRVLHDPAVRAAARRVAQAYSTQDGAAACARIVEETIG